MRNDNERGVIQIRERAQQIISFEGLNLDRNITPTDIDMFVEFKGNSFVYGEFKLSGSSLEDGQRIALENAVNSHTSKGHSSCALLIYHNVMDAKEDIIAKNQIVSRVYHEGRWKEWKHKRETVKGFFKRWSAWNYNNNIEL